MAQAPSRRVSAMGCSTGETSSRRVSATSRSGWEAPNNRDSGCGLGDVPSRRTSESGCSGPEASQGYGFGEAIRRRASTSGDVGGRVSTAAGTAPAAGTGFAVSGTASSASTNSHGAQGLPRYLKVNRQLGKGAYGEVFLCDDTRDGSQVAVKWIRDFAREPLFGKRILREIRILSALRHPNLLRLVDMLPVPGPDFCDVALVMPYMHCDLQKVIYSKMKLSPSHVMVFACQILHGLKYLHAAGVVHRDIKPSNILVNKDCTLRIADMGLARGRADPQEDLTGYVVTRWYRAPELLLMPLGYFEAVDVWSVGCIHAEVLTRRPLFPGENHVDMIRRVAGVLGFCRDRDLKWIPEDEVVRQDVLKFVDSLDLPEGPTRSSEGSLEQRLPGVTEDGLDFIRRLLTIDPTQRISAADAISHRYIAHLKDSYEDIPAPGPFVWDFDHFEPTKEALQERIYSECARMHPEILARDQKRGVTVAEPVGPCPTRRPGAPQARQRATQNA
eukprot:TRINITY_DN57492_c0_g1_i1.p1 TRINITY_DN57492_c0_g1~~TRINITY_DN57492_c0_g1_i1.p1  ORF type:complete len:587 (+),score=76.74 TRINITY_DN57492_c0_g1_i1:256-1761(+)